MQEQQAPACWPLRVAEGTLAWMRTPLTSKSRCFKSIKPGHEASPKEYAELNPKATCICNVEGLSRMPLASARTMMISRNHTGNNDVNGLPHFFNCLVFNACIGSALLSLAFACMWGPANAQPAEDRDRRVAALFHPGASGSRPCAGHRPASAFAQEGIPVEYFFKPWTRTLEESRAGLVGRHRLLGPEPCPRQRLS